MNTQNMIRGGRYGVAALLLLGTSIAAIAQAPPPADDAQVTADTATHTAMLTGTGEGTAWFLVDPQNNTVRWHIEYTGAEPTGAAIMCPPEEGGAAPAGDNAATGGLMGAITIVDRGDAAAPATPAGGAPAAPAAGAAPAAPAGGAPAAPAAGEAPAAGMAGDMAGDMTGMVEAINLLEAGGTMESPLEGQTADLGDAVFDALSTGACFLNLTVADAGPAEAPAAAPGAAPATPRP